MNDENYRKLEAPVPFQYFRVSGLGSHLNSLGYRIPLTPKHFGVWGPGFPGTARRAGSQVSGLTFPVFRFLYLIEFSLLKQFTAVQMAYIFYT